MTVSDGMVMSLVKKPIRKIVKSCNLILKGRGKSSSRKSRVEHKWYDHIIHRETDSQIRSHRTGDWLEKGKRSSNKIKKRISENWFGRIRIEARVCRRSREMTYPDQSKKLPTSACWDNGVKTDVVVVAAAVHLLYWWCWCWEANQIISPE